MPTANLEIKMITQEELKRVLHCDPKTGIFTNLIKASQENGFIHRKPGVS